jgi:hypothetical protein
LMIDVGWCAGREGAADKRASLAIGDAGGA